MRTSRSLRLIFGPAMMISIIFCYSLTAGAEGVAPGTTVPTTTLPPKPTTDGGKQQLNVPTIVGDKCPAGTTLETFVSKDQQPAEKTGNLVTLASAYKVTVSYERIGDNTYLATFWYCKGQPSKSAVYWILLVFRWLMPYLAGAAACYLWLSRRQTPVTQPGASR